MRTLLTICSAGFGSFGFAVVFGAQRNRWLYAGLGGALSWAVYLGFCRLGCAEAVGAGLAAAVVTLYAEILARVQKLPATVYAMLCSIPLIPGGSLYRLIDCLMRGETQAAGTYGVMTAGFAIAMAIGMAAVTGLFRIASRAKRIGLQK